MAAALALTQDAFDETDVFFQYAYIVFEIANVDFNFLKHFEDQIELRGKELFQYPQTRSRERGSNPPAVLDNDIREVVHVFHQSTE
jgi:hypothetical protein